MDAPLYNQTQITGQETSWKRAKVIEIKNEFNQAPVVLFAEEIATTLATGETVTKRSTQMSVVLSDMTETFQSVDVSTGQVITRSVGQFAADLTSYYVAKAQARDAAEAPKS